MQRRKTRSGRAATPRLDAIGARLAADIAGAGWLPIDLARASHVSHMAVSRYLSGERRTPRMAKKLATALEKPVLRYQVVTPARRQGERTVGQRRKEQP